jgi:hypothetical protein
VAKMPNAEQALVPREKVVDYLLSASHPIGARKAVFFRSFGFDIRFPEVFRDALVAHANTHDFSKVAVTAYGTKYEVDGALATPSGRLPKVRSVWIVEGVAGPRLVTALPEKAKKL